MNTVYLYTFVCLISTTLGTSIKRSSGCDTAQLKSCTEAMANADKIFTFRKRGADGPLSECGLYDEMVTCLNRNNLLANCAGTEEWFSARILVDSFGYMCTEGRRETLANMDCFDNPDVEDAVDTCIKNFQSDLSSSGDPCGSVAKIPDCVADETLQVCSPGAASAMKDIMHHGLRSLGEMFNC
ncbi:hypothetical protein SNE40_012740 [Patella caerulea]|uniref:Uncharacterized protein n=1 Tax=Patella caerulea TaxID=87958 RepID=A0AAN8JN36_PATCE